MTARDLDQMKNASAYYRPRVDHPAALHPIDPLSVGLPSRRLAKQIS